MSIEDPPNDIQHKCYQYLEITEVALLRNLSRNFRRRVSLMLRAMPWDVRYEYPWRHEDEAQEERGAYRVLRRRIALGEIEERPKRPSRESHGFEWLKNVFELAPRARVLSMVRCIFTYSV